MRYVLVLFFILIASMAMAENVTLAWDYTDDALLAPDGGFKLYQKKLVDSAYSSTPASTVVSGIHTITLNVSVGKWCWVVKAYKADLESLPSNEVCGQVLPNKPLNLRVQ
jgi:hypothetical protein